MSIPPFPAESYATLSYDVLEAELLVVIKHRSVTLADLPGIMDRSYAALGQAIKSGIFVPVGPAISQYFGDPKATFDVEVGFPAMGAPTQPIPTPAGVIETSSFPAGRAALLSHIGSYDGLGAAWNALMTSIEGTPRGPWIEVYFNDPSSTPEEQLRTDLVLPLKL